MADDRPAEALTGTDLDTWAALATLLEWLPPALDAQLLRDSGLTHFEYGILFALADAPDHSLRMSILAGYANSSLSRLSRAASRLETRGWMRRTPDPDDGRSTLAVLTDEGLERWRQATPGHVRTVRALVLDGLTPTEKDQLRTISRRVMQAIRQEPEWHPSARSSP
jgi:DNA-binding MarR family transcriptional regulator